MSVATQTFGLPVRIQHGGSYAAIGLRVYKRLIARIQERLEARRQQEAEHALFALAAQYESSMPSFAAELRAAAARR
ncbi:MAG: hypothetical protein JO224_07085 [Pelomonas sp.]|nr:hypothetical protein [Roseateles sp.]